MKYLSKNKEIREYCNTVFNYIRELGYNMDLTQIVFVGGGALDFNIKVVPFDREGSNLRGLCRIYIEDSFIVSNVSIPADKG